MSAPTNIMYAIRLCCENGTGSWLEASTLRVTDLGHASLWASRSECDKFVKALHVEEGDVRVVPIAIHSKETT